MRRAVTRCLWPQLFFSWHVPFWCARCGLPIRFQQMHTTLRMTIAHTNSLFNRVDDNGALLRYEVDLFKAPPAAKHRGAIFPCYNLAYTSDAEQWDGLRDAANVEKLKKLNQQCYFNVGVCKEHDRPPSETSEESKHAKEGKESIKIFVPSNVPYVKKLFSNERLALHNRVRIRIPAFRVVHQRCQ